MCGNRFRVCIDDRFFYIGNSRLRNRRRICGTAVTIALFRRLESDKAFHRTLFVLFIDKDAVIVFTNSVLIGTLNVLFLHIGNKTLGLLFVVQRDQRNHIGSLVVNQRDIAIDTDCRSERVFLFAIRAVRHCSPLFCTTVFRGSGGRAPPKY